MTQLGKIIQEKREALSLTMKDVSYILKIREPFISAIEQDNIKFFASKAYYYGYLKQYLKYLQLTDINIPHESSEKHHLIITTPIKKTFKPNFLFILSIMILSLIVTNYFENNEKERTLDLVTLEMNQHLSEFAQAK